MCAAAIAGRPDEALEKAEAIAAAAAALETDDVVVEVEAEETAEVRWAKSNLNFS
jgi:hypothetical protein